MGRLSNEPRTRVRMGIAQSGRAHEGTQSLETAEGSFRRGTPRGGATSRAGQHIAAFPGPATPEIPRPGNGIRPAEPLELRFVGRRGRVPEDPRTLGRTDLPAAGVLP